MRKLIFIIIVAILLTGCINSAQNTQDLPTAESETIIPANNDSNMLYENYANISLIAKLAGHSSRLWTLDASDHNTFVTGGRDGKIILRDAETMEILYEGKDHTKLVEEIFFLNNGDVLSISNDNSIRKLKSESGESQKIYSNTTKEFTFSRNETLIAVSSGDAAIIYEYDSFKEVQTIDFTDGCFDIRFSSDASLIYSVGHNGKVQKWSVETGELLHEYEGITNDVHCMEITNDDKYIIAGSIDRKVCVWDTETGELVSKYMHTGGLYDLDVSEDGKLIASVGTDKKVYLAELETGKVLSKLKHDDEILAVAIDPNSKYIIAGGYDSVVYVWGFDKIETENLSIINVNNAENVELVGELKGHTGWVFDADISHNNKWVASAERGSISKVNIWDIYSKTVLQSFEIEQAPIELEFTLDDKYLLCKGEQGDFRIWDIANSEFIYSSAESGYEVFSVDMSSDSKMLVTGGRHGEIIIWDFETMEIIKQAQFDDEFIMQAIFSSDDSMIAFSYAGGTEDFSAHVISSEDLSEIYHTEGHTGYNYTLDFADKSGVLASCSADNLIKLWDEKTGELIITIKGHTGKVMDVDFSIDEDIIVSGSAHDHSARIWNVQTGDQIIKIRPGGEVQVVEMSADGKFFISSGEDGTISIWGVHE